MLISEVIAVSLLRHGGGTVFGLMGDGNMSMLEAYSREGGRFVASRHEAAAVAMAAGFALAGGGLGLCTVTCGPGLTQVATTLISAVRRRVPVLLFAGRADSIYDQQYLDQKRFVESCGAVFYAIGPSDNAAEVVSHAARVARVRRIPVVVEAGIRIQEGEDDWGEWNQANLWPDDSQLQPRAESQSYTRIMPEIAFIDELRDRIIKAKRPVILAGYGAVASGAREEILEVAHRYGALTATTLYAKGWLDSDPFALGISGLYASAIGEELLSEADLVVAVGASLNRYTTEGGLTFGDAEVVTIDIAPLPESRFVSPELEVIGDAKLVLRALLSEDPDGAERGPAFRTTETAMRIQNADQPGTYGADKKGLDPRALMARLESFIQPSDLIVVGVGHFQDFVIQYLCPRYQNEFIFTLGFGAIGEGLSTAIGASAVDPTRRVLLIEGDGGIITHIQELDTVSRYGLPLDIVVMNDEALGAELHKLRARNSGTLGAELRSPDLAKIANAFGLHGQTVATVDALEEAFARGAHYSFPRLIDVRISDQVVSDPFLKLYFGEINAAPNQIRYQS